MKGPRILLVFANPYSRVKKHLPYGLMRLKEALPGCDVEIVDAFQLCPSVPGESRST